MESVLVTNNSDRKVNIPSLYEKASKSEECSLKDTRYSEEKPSICNICHEVFSEKDLFDKHALLHSEDKADDTSSSQKGDVVRKCKCHICGKTYKGRYELRLHSYSHTGQRPHTCPVCAKTYRRVSHLNTHFRKHTGEKPYKCEMCSKSFPQLCNLKAHLLVHTGEKPYVCHVCQRGFPQKSNLDRHLETHSDEKPFECEKCSKSFTNAWQLNRHSLIHTKKERKTYYSKMHPILPRNEENIHKNIQPYTENKFDFQSTCHSLFSKKQIFGTTTIILPFIPHVCQIVLRNEENLEEVIQSYSEEPPALSTDKRHFLKEEVIREPVLPENKADDNNNYYDNKKHKCHSCEKVFKTKTDLNRHNLSHTGERPYKCEVCPKTFLRKTHLKTHLLNHTGEKPYKCEICPKSFQQLCHLKMHMLVHSGEKPHVCPVCRKGFSQKPNMDKHILSHTGERPYKCEYCPKAFFQAVQLREHRLIIHTCPKEKSHICPKCQKGFLTKLSLQRHLRSHAKKHGYYENQKER